MATLWTHTFDFKSKAGMLCMGHDDDEVMLNVLRCQGQVVTNAEARFASLGGR